MTEVGTRNSLHVPSATHVNSHKIKVPCILQILGQLVFASQFTLCKVDLFNYQCISFSKV